MVNEGAKVVTAYPLQWPAGRKRATWRQTARFGSKHGMTLGRARDEVFKQIKLLGGRLPILSSNLQLRNDGLPYASQRQPDDPGVAVYFTYKGKQHCFASDCWNKVEDNVLGIAKTIDALRGIERWGTGDMLERAFVGFQALPHMEAEQWFQVLGVSSRASRDEIDTAYRSLAMKHHPDRGGDSAQMARINAARDQGYQSIGV